MTEENRMEFNAEVVKKCCNGMLPPDVYQAIYDAARNAPEPVFVEVGTAHGASTVSLAMGLRDSGRKGKVFSFEKIVGGSREAFGDVEENIKIIERNLAVFGVEDLVHLTIGDVVDTADIVPKEERIGLLCLDADGAIDRDFGLFFNQLVPSAPIIIDDVRDSTRVNLIGRVGINARLKIDQKHKLTFRLMELFRNYNLVDDGVVLGFDTWVGRKGTGQWAELREAEMLEVYRSLTFSEAKVSLIPARKNLGRALRRVAPANVIAKLRHIESGE